MQKEGEDNNNDENPDLTFEPVIKLEKEVEVKTHEEEEDVLYKQYDPSHSIYKCDPAIYSSIKFGLCHTCKTFYRRAKLFRFDKASEGGEWKERGTGDVRFLQHNNTKKIRLVMRRDKTHKVCANHHCKPQSKILNKAIC